jgi:N6-L-threonylcarbamoyladenine synthase
LGKPLIAVNHSDGHVHAVFLEAYAAGRVAELPAVCLIVSGGHTVLYEVKHADGGTGTADALLQYRKIGQTRDDAAGEAYDKVAKLLGLGYPGGPILDKLAAAAGNVAAPIKFSPTKTRGNALDFSFSGMKTAVLYHLREHPEYNEEIEARKMALEHGQRSYEQLLPLCGEQTLGLVREFQNAVVRDLVERTLAAAEELAVKSILVSGGVAANSQLRTAFVGRGAKAGIEVFFPSRALSTDNAAMIAAAAFPRLQAGIIADITLNADPGLALSPETVKSG